MVTAVSVERYRELGPLAEGGMAQLFAAIGPDGSQVVIKRIRVPFVYDQAYQSLFRDEGAVAAALDHPNIVRLLDQGEDDLGPFLVFELVPGTDLGVVLDEHLKSGRPLDDGEVIAIALPLFKALDAAHRAACKDGNPLCVVHRDVSPGNVLLSEGGEVKLADFGVASSTLKTDVTQAGEMKGKFAYMAPEQTRGERVDARSDLFAAGVVLYECLAGQRLFDGPTDADVVHAVRSESPPLLVEKNPRVDEKLAALVAELLEKDPTRRPASAGDVVKRLEAIAEDLGLDHGLKRRVSQLARQHPRPTLEGPSPEAQLGARRRTQRVLQASAPTSRTRRRSPALVGGVTLALAAAGFVLVGVGRDEVVAPGAVGAATSTTAPPALPKTSPAAVSPAAVEPTPVETAGAALPPAAREPTATAPETARVPDVTPPPTVDSPPPKPEQTVAARSVGVNPAPVRANAASARRAAPSPSGTAEKPRRVMLAGDAKAGYGRLYLNSEPWAEVTVDGSSLGANTPVMGLRLPAGRHVITLKNPHYGISRTLDVDVPAGGDLRKFVDLSKR